MRLKTFRAATMAEALAQVKKDLGKEAVILHTRSYKQGAILGFGGRPTIEITASVDVNAPAFPARTPRGAGLQPADSTPPSRLTPTALGKAYGLPPQPPITPTPIPQASSTPDITSPPLRESPRLSAPPRSSLPTSLSPSSPPSSSTVSEDMRSELAAIKRMVGQVLQSSPAAGSALAAPPMPAALVDHYMKLIEADVARELADRIAASVRDELTPAELADPQIVRQGMIRHLEDLLPETETPLPNKPVDGRPLTLALIGPTGVGKTTTVAKLAAAYKLRHGRKIGLITADTYRIAAVEQLRTYANIIGVPLKVVMTPQEMAAACDEFAGFDAVLIDTAGRSPTDSPRLAELAEHLAAARPHQTHLVLSSVLGDAAMLRVIERYKALNPGHVIFTKLDEAASYGVLLNIAGRLHAKLAYVTTGQEVPDDIEPGRADRLARLILDGAAATA